MSDSLQPHGLQHARPPCPSPTLGVYPNSIPSSQWCHPTISCSIIPFSSCLQSFPASGSFPMSQFFASDGQSIGVSASTSVLPMNTQDWSPLGWTVGSPCSPRDSQESSPTLQFKSINSISSFLRKLHTVLHSGCINIVIAYRVNLRTKITREGSESFLVGEHVQSPRQWHLGRHGSSEPFSPYPVLCPHTLS